MVNHPNRSKVAQVRDVEVTTGKWGLWQFSYRLGNKIQFGPTCKTEKKAWSSLAEDLAERGLTAPSLSGLSD